MDYRTVHKAMLKRAADFKVPHSDGQRVPDPYRWGKDHDALHKEIAKRTMGGVLDLPWFSSEFLRRQHKTIEALNDEGVSPREDSIAKSLLTDKGIKAMLDQDPKVRDMKLRQARHGGLTGDIWWLKHKFGKR